MNRTLDAAWDEAADEAREKARADPKQEIVAPPVATKHWLRFTAF